MAHMCLSTPRPFLHSLAQELWKSAAWRSSLAASLLLPPRRPAGVSKESTNRVEADVTLRIVSVRPCRKFMVLQLSYAHGVKWCRRRKVTWYASCRKASGPTLSFLISDCPKEQNLKTCISRLSTSSLICLTASCSLGRRPLSVSLDPQGRDRSVGATGAAADPLRTGKDCARSTACEEKITPVCPSPQECSMFTPALPSGKTMTLRDLSNQRLTPRLWSNEDATSLNTRGTSESSDRTKSAESNALYASADTGSCSMLLLTAAQVSLFSEVKTHGEKAGSSGVSVMILFRVLAILSGSSSRPLLSKMSKLQSCPLRSTAMWRGASAVTSSSQPAFGTRVVPKIRGY
mmetsp:Transcript_27798/g.64120  ORF Transcript_27798/g.64120 Transcript_27798/m.64120 type:complete len:347 (-) Transcript_27798:561-1601(-)